MGDHAEATLSEFVQFLPWMEELKLDPTDLAGIRVRSEPPPDDVFISLGELPPGAPKIERSVLSSVGSRQIYVARPDTSSRLWTLLTTWLTPRRPSGSVRMGMFGNDFERWIDEESPELSWRRIDAGQQIPPGPLEL